VAQLVAEILADGGFLRAGEAGSLIHLRTATATD
jgi:hypothetical protein